MWVALSISSTELWYTSNEWPLNGYKGSQIFKYFETETESIPAEIT